MARHEGFAVFLEKKCGPASPAPNVDRSRPGPARDHVHGHGHGTGTGRARDGRCAESLETLPAPTHTQTHTQDRYPALRGENALCALRQRSVVGDTALD